MVNTHPEQAPASLKRASALKKNILDGKVAVKTVGQPEKVIPEVQEVPHPTTESVTASVQKTTTTREDALRLLFPEGSRETIELITDIGRFKFKVEALDIGEYGLGFMLADEAFMEPVIGAIIRIKIRRQEYRVVYMGGCFRFKTVGYNLITFLFAAEEE